MLPHLLRSNHGGVFQSLPLKSGSWDASCSQQQRWAEWASSISSNEANGALARLEFKKWDRLFWLENLFPWSMFCLCTEAAQDCQAHSYPEISLVTLKDWCLGEMMPGVCERKREGEERKGEWIFFFFPLWEECEVFSLHSKPLTQRSFCTEFSGGPGIVGKKCVCLAHNMERDHTNIT